MQRTTDSARPPALVIAISSYLSPLHSYAESVETERCLAISSADPFGAQTNHSAGRRQAVEESPINLATNGSALLRDRTGHRYVTKTEETKSE